MAVTKTTAWSLGTAGLCVALSAASWFLLIEPERAEAADSREQTVLAEQANTELEVRIEQLRREYVDLPTRQAELAAVRQALPDEPALASLVRQLTDAGTDSGVKLDSIVTGAAAAVIDPDAAAAPAEGEPSAPAEGEVAPEPAPEPSAEPSAEPTAAGTDGAPADGVTAVDGAPVGAVLASVPITVTTTGDFAAINLYVKNIQADIPRAFLIDALGVAVIDAVEGTEDVEEVEEGTVTATITARVFVFVDPDSTPLDDASAPAETT